MTLTLLRNRLIGAFGMIALALLAGGIGARLVPDMTALDAPARILDSLAPWSLALALLVGVVLALLRARVLGVLTVVAALGGAGWILGDYLAVRQGFSKEDPALKVLFFNALGSNTANSARIVDAVLAQLPDIAVIAESEAIAEDRARLEAVYPHTSVCADAACDVMLFSRIAPVSLREERIGPLWNDRYLEASLDTPSGPLTLVAAHLSKPWFSGVSPSEHWTLIRRLRQIEGPLVVVGDWNMALWSRPAMQILHRTNLKAPPAPIPSWPAQLGKWGVPIDQVLVRDGAALGSLHAFGEDLGSNHRGMLATVVVNPPAQTSSPASASVAARRAP
ncbi:hypothetical protein AQS8620_01278 [Aquimixticola soesokkakensis]|uniref:Endonuclease/exonuclease/phosphatase domain-containing protein n=1 Tax=Aquimixticola soesokkakensis TaxID=1519096 RepID=A0A1Y5SET4_9RHOB|nr:endonuclease/exonuclease/phosphatase family protein [Aquimixticola soesokkakensis]SLN36050.1 hypothetical protein AQS8620_01278 [Aquimixticola soesokkakensis]